MGDWLSCERYLDETQVGLGEFDGKMNATNRVKLRLKTIGDQIHKGRNME